MLNLNIRLYELYNNKKNERVNAKIILLTSTELTSIYVLRTLYSIRVHVLLEIILKSNTMISKLCMPFTEKHLV